MASVVSMHRLFAVALVVLMGTSLSIWADDTSTNSVTLPTLPKEYAAYQIDADHLSPDGQYGVMYPSAPPDDDTTVVKNFVVGLKPFRIVLELPKNDDAYFADKSHADFAATWAKDSSVVIVMLNSRWGPGTALLMPIKDGKAGKVTDLTAAVRKLVQPDLDKVKHDRYNENYDFVFDGETDWTITDKGQVMIDVDCATNPKHDSGTKSWAGSFSGTWDTAQGKFVEHHFKRTFTGEYPDQ